MEKRDQPDPHLADIFRRATLEREQQDQRLGGCPRNKLSGLSAHRCRVGALRR
jgi:hypothetical protein